MEKCFDFRLRCLDAALLEIGLAAAPALEFCGHILAQLPQISLPGHQAEGVASFVAAGEHRRGAAADFADGIGQLPDATLSSSGWKCTTSPWFT